MNLRTKTSFAQRLFWKLGPVLGLSCLGATRVFGQAQDVLRNPGFESPNAAEYWDAAVYGAKSKIEADPQEVREGRQSLRISATEPSDTALGQEVQLKPSQWYKFSGSVKTQGLDPLDAPTFGTLQVQNPGGRGIIAAGSNHGGDQSWTNVAVFFKAPADGRARMCLFFVGFGKGKGTAWFDGLHLEETDLTRFPVKVTRDPVCPGKISPLQYGQFVEYLCNLVPGMWAEKLYDGSFEGLSPYQFVFLKETDFKEKPWYPSGAVNRTQITADRETKISGQVSKKILIDDGAPATAGISQDGLAVQTGQACTLQCYLRGLNLKGPVRITLHHEGRVLSSCEFQPDGEWKKYRARLVPSGTDHNVTLTIEFRGPGTLWLDNASLMPERTVGGWRPDVVEAVRRLKPGIIRMGGSALEEPSMGDFEWKDTIGDPDRRKPFRAWGGLQPTGPGLEEFVQFCRTVGAEPMLCVRFSRRTPADAAAQVQYFNGATNTPMGAWRARNGHPEPYRIKYWQVGNEQVSREYDEGAAAFCRAMKEVDPSIKLLSSFPTPALLKNAGDLLDYVCPHHYGQNLEGWESDLVNIRQIIRQNAPGRELRVGVTEWNSTAGDWDVHRAMLWGLGNALYCSRYHNLMHRHCDLIEIANRSNLINSFCSGIIQTDNHRLYFTPAYYAQELYATLAGNRPLRLESEVPPQAGPDISATLSDDGAELTVFAVNDTLDEIRRTLDFSAYGKRGQEVRIWTLFDHQRAGEPDVVNSFAAPERIAPVASQFKGASASFEYRFPALSLTVLRWKVK
jgi:alpha-N-arabinofuranosidase